MKIKLIKSSFYNEKDTKKKLCDFLKNAKILSMNSECKKFEKKFSYFQKRKFSVFVTSGSAANLLLIQALLNMKKIKKGSRVGISSLTWSTNVMPLIQLGLKPIVIDCEINTTNVSLRQIKKYKIDALLLTNALGLCSDIGPIADYCKEKGILLIEDNCESMGSEYKGKKLGNFGFASTFSFFVGHHLSTIEGGMVCTDNKKLYENLLIARIHGWARNLPLSSQKKLQKKYKIDDFYNKYTFYDLAYNVRPNEISGFLGNIQMKYVTEIIEKRESNFKKIHSVIKNNPDLFSLEVSHISKISNFGVPIICKNKKLFEKYKYKFELNGVEIRPIISGNIQRQPFFRKYCEKKSLSKCPNANLIHKQGFYCGNSPEMTDKELDFICNLLKNE